MIRKLLLVGAAVALPISAIAALGTPASAVVKVDATHFTATCAGVSGTAKFTPPIKTAGVPTEKTTIKVKLSGCSAVGSPAVTIVSGAAAGVLTATNTTGLRGLIGSTAQNGTLSTKWETSPTLSSGPTSFTVHSVTGSTDGLPGQFTIPGSSPNTGVTGSFQGTDNGAGDVTIADTTQTTAQILAACQSKTGLKSISFKPPSSGTAITLK